jgi:hypothetical protein
MRIAYRPAIASRIPALRWILGAADRKEHTTMKDPRTLSRHVDGYTVATALVGFALFGALAFVLVGFFFTPS